jgi:hypothetical protein
LPHERVDLSTLGSGSNGSSRLFCAGRDRGERRDVCVQQLGGATHGFRRLCKSGFVLGRKVELRCPRKDSGRALQERRDLSTHDLESSGSSCLLGAQRVGLRPQDLLRRVCRRDGRSLLRRCFGSMRRSDRNLRL